MMRERYGASDFDFCLAHLEELNLFYVFPVEVFIGYGSEIHLVEADKSHSRLDLTERTDDQIKRSVEVQ